MTVDKDAFWSNMFGPVGLEVEVEPSLTGASGYKHRVAASAQDDEKRLALVLTEPDPIKALLIGQDIQSALPEHRVITTRPVVGDTKEIVSSIAQLYTQALLEGRNPSKEFEQWIAPLKEAENDPGAFKELTHGTPLEGLVRAMLYGTEVLGLGVYEQVVQIIRELLLLNVPEMIRDEGFDFASLMKRTPYQSDILRGVCPLPFGALSQEHWDLFFNYNSDNQARSDVLHELGLFQFFRPPVDSLALVLAEKSKLTPVRLQSVAAKSTELGHSIDVPELVEDVDSVDELIQRLKEEEYVVDGEVEVTITAEGRAQRSLVRFKPREALFFRLARVLPDLIGSLKS